MLGTEGHQPQKASFTRQAAKNSIFTQSSYSTTLQVNFLKNFTMLTNYVEIWYVIGPLCLALG